MSMPHESKRISTRTLNDIMQELNDTHKLIYLLFQQMNTVIEELEKVPRNYIHVHLIVQDEIDSTNKRIDELRHTIERLEYYRDNIKNDSISSSCT